MQTSAQLGVQTARPTAGRFRQLVVPIHSEIHPLYGPIDITAGDIAQMVANFNAGVKTYSGASPVEIDHDDSRGAGGWVTRVWAEADGLWAEGEYTPSGAAAIEEETYPFISPNLWDEWTDPVSGQTHADVFDGFALVVRPQFRELPPATVQHYTEDPHPTVIVFGSPTLPHQQAGALEEIMADETVAVEETAAEEAVEETTDEAVEAAADEVTTDEAADEAAEDADEVADEVAEDDGDADPAATDPTDPAYVGQTGQGQAQPVQAAATFSEADAAELAAYRAESVKRFGEQIGGMRFGENGKSVVTPASRERLQSALAKLPRQYSEPVLEALGQLEFCELGERGAPLKPKVETAQTFGEADARVAAQLGLTEEDYQ